MGHKKHLPSSHPTSHLSLNSEPSVTQRPSFPVSYSTLSTQAQTCPHPHTHTHARPHMHSRCWPLITSPPALAPAAVQTAWRTSQWGQHWSSRRRRWMGYPSTSAGHIWTEGCTACSSGKQAQVTWLCGHFKSPGCWLAPDTGGSRAQCLVVSSHSSLYI